MDVAQTEHARGGWTLHRLCTHGVDGRYTDCAHTGWMDVTQTVHTRGGWTLHRLCTHGVDGRYTD